MIPYGKQDINENDIAAVEEVLRSPFLTQGPCLAEFEQSICDATNAKHAIATNSATAALHIACLALGVGEGDIVWTSPVSFVASANCAIYCGAKIDFVDIDPSSFNMSVSCLEEKLKRAKLINALPKVVIPVHLSGQSCDMEAIWKLSREYNFSIIEDASHAIGAYYKNEPVGQCRYSDIAVFSFHPVKIITTAEGGCAVTQDQHLAQKLSLLRSHGITRDEKLMTHEKDGQWYYQQVMLGFNYRMTELQAALGRSQMTRLRDFVEVRNKFAVQYDALLSKLPLDTPVRSSDTYSSFHLYIIQLQIDQISKTHETVFSELRDAGIGVNLHYIPIHIQPYYQNLGFRPGDFPNAEAYYSKSLSIPLHSGMCDEDVHRVVNSLKEVLT
ncbi:MULTISPECIES: UDP-4-amino-4,6-dideoxy-N-acetyl-beta-L-altrosamine transaminase [unclassified Pseudovibrio]|uniref:UDP-4-amino-4, 6-dideoxy-N-acetyl-beta-L-altrosamine transaminase n=1 Tax=unclassified Pseudovibrio TaxID=2627060 RepID=UPI0007AE3E0E|nr:MULTISPECIES: UDP-4-amino-4,6-dideoxy-N-acetyl-beta-L-altrosamine transaminase [unclassified Pseudovibrio]KZL01868.1 UDP-4-amino-4,6-dideoxy-N-acetyl-beta-L-altrosamine transaminase [Pseudovibrio sp. W74]KZL02970.1 UDP-4-amino-4,6-dideoxy-N-acetyl-beta-L-altrosamine transaminase [Pseudovibrio sp. Ad14]